MEKGNNVRIKGNGCEGFIEGFDEKGNVTLKITKSNPKAPYALNSIVNIIPSEVEVIINKPSQDK